MVGGWGQGTTVARSIESGESRLAKIMGQYGDDSWFEVARADVARSRTLWVKPLRSGLETEIA